MQNEFFSPRVGRLPSYATAGGYNQPDDVVMLASNESAWGPAPEVIDAAARSVSRSNRYPDPSGHALREALSLRYGVPTEQIALGNGSVDVLLAAGDALLQPGTDFVYAWPSFSMYRIAGEAPGANLVEVPVTDDQHHDLDAMQRAISDSTRLVAVCNPNNPTSTALPLSEIAPFIEDVPKHVTVLLDEAYCEYNQLDDPDASLQLLEKHSNLILLRTFSKVHGLASLRVGFALCGNEAFVRAINTVRQPFFCNGVAQAAAIEALRHEEAVADRVARTIASRTELEAGLQDLGIRPFASQANFAWFDLAAPTDEGPVVDGLADRGVLVRAGSDLGRPGALRVTYGTPEENSRFLTALAELIS